MNDTPATLLLVENDPENAQNISGGLRPSEALFRMMSDASPLGILVSDDLGHCVYSNAAYQKISGLHSEQILGTHWSMAILPEDRERALAEWQEAVSRQTPFKSEVRFLRADQRTIWTRLNAAGMHDGVEAGRRVQTVEDISERKAAERDLRLSEDALFYEKERAEVTLNSIGDAVLTTDLAGQVSYLNQVAEKMTGWPSVEALGRALPEVFNIVDGATREPAVNPALRAIEGGKTVGLAADCILIHRDGFESSIEDSASPIHNRDGAVSGAVIVFHDVSVSRAMALKMTYLAQHDFLTDLPNRALLTERLSQAMKLANRRHARAALLFVDLDGFKHVNDSLGHVIGDQLLQSVAGRLVSGVRDTDTVCRQGGDEFVILLAEVEQPADAARVAEKLLAACALPHLIGGNELHVTMSIGISIYPDDSDNMDAVMQDADTAMFHAKDCGRNNYQFFRAEMNTRAMRRLGIENGLRRALKQAEFQLYFQPQIDLATGKMTGAEALLRWQDPENGLVYPMQFIPIAEECGLIVPIGRWVLHEACRQVCAWIDSGLCAVPVAVNISALEFCHKDFLKGVAQILQDTGMPPAFLELELTESVLMHDAESSASVLDALKAMGVRLAIDDFGTGYSSLSYLNRFPIDTLKIDQSFVRELASDADNPTIVSAVIGMGRNLHQRVIAEGVETRAQFAFLLKHQCNEGQGFLFSQPLNAKDFSARLSHPDLLFPS
ncbi:MAG: response regulator receiver modulated diguanylate cyclase/phosphodiesterase with sensor(s) [Proteobacteria bacterium]|nr:response regulator receiver modulated diguanylate cyclase/phosphodiesterase with sensor(s) [Pseudomonadota bacterium]